MNAITKPEFALFSSGISLGILLLSIVCYVIYRDLGFLILIIIEIFLFYYQFKDSKRLLL